MNFTKNDLIKMDLQDYKSFVLEKQAEEKYIKKEINKLKKQKKQKKVKALKQEKALAFVKEIAFQTQQQLEYHINDMVSHGLNSVFNDVFDFVVNFVKKRGKIECDLFFKKGKNLIDPLTYSGLGAADIAAFALRCASWSIAKKYRNVFLLDEPLKHLSNDKHMLAGKMIKELAKQLGLQIIMVTHSKKMVEFADKVFEVTKTGKISKVKEIN